MPIPFEVDGGWPLLLARALSVAALLSLLGTEVFRALVLPRCQPAMRAAVAQRLGRWLARLATASLALAAAAELAWLALQTADLASAHSLGAAFAAVPTVLQQTVFGHLIVLQLGALAVTAAALGWGRRGPALACATLTCALQSGHSHAASMYDGPSLLLAANVAHVLAAGVWLGGLVPLGLTVAAAPARAGALAARWFSPIGKLAVVALAGSAAYQAWIVVGSIPGLVGTGYGWVVLGKLALFGVLFGFAVLNRYRLAPALLRSAPARPRRRLLYSLAWQTGAGVTVVAASALLSSMAPAMHVQPVWPFPVWFSPITRAMPMAMER